MTLEILAASTQRRGLLATVAALGCLALSATQAFAVDRTSFNLIRTRGWPPTCAPDATAFARLETLGVAERLTVTVRGFRPGTPLVCSPFRCRTRPSGSAGTWAISRPARAACRRASSPASTTRPSRWPWGRQPRRGRTARATNPIFRPVHTFHLGIRFDSVQAGAGNGCVGGPTPFNGDHTAGIQVLNTGTFNNRVGPLRLID